MLLSCPRPGIRVDLDAREQVGVSPVVSSRSPTHAALHRVRYKVRVGIAGRDVSIGIVGGIVQRHVAGVGMKDGDDLRLGVGRRRYRS